MEAVTADKVWLMESVLASMGDHHDRGDETVTASEIAMALGEDEREVRWMMRTLVGSGYLDTVVYRHPESQVPSLMYWLTNYEEVK
jgi:transcription initiation factor IIE alpha subunit